MEFSVHFLCCKYTINFSFDQPLSFCFGHMTAKSNKWKEKDEKRYFFYFLSFKKMNY